MAIAMGMAVIVNTSYVSGTLYTSSHLIPKAFYMGNGNYILPFYLPMGKLRLKMVIWLTQDYTTVPVFKHRSLSWSLHGILIMRGHS